MFPSYRFVHLILKRISGEEISSSWSDTKYIFCIKKKDNWWDLPEVYRSKKFEEKAVGNDYFLSPLNIDVNKEIIKLKSKKKIWRKQFFM